MVTDSDERQVAEYALMADDSASPEHFSVMFPTTCGSRVPQRDLRSAGFDWALRKVRIQPCFCSYTTYPIAAIKQAGGVAMATRTRATRAVKMNVQAAYILTRLKDLKMLGIRRERIERLGVSKDGGYSNERVF